MSEEWISPPRRRFHRFAWGVLGYNLLVILWGAYVRATGSGAGCGSNWPTCNGEIVPREPSVETLIEYSHRITSGLALLAVVALVAWAWRLFPKSRFPQGHRVRGAAVASLVLMLLEAGIGAGLVLFELVADNASMARALFMGTHLGNTFLLLAALALTAYFAGGGRPFRLRGESLSRLAVGSLLVAMVMGVSGAVTALGDTLLQAGTLEGGLRQDLSLTSHVLIQLRVFHPFLAVLGGLFLLHFVGRVRAERRPQPARSWATALNLLVLVQFAVGGLNIVLMAPVWMQLVHLLLADAMWIALVLTVAAALVVPEEADADAAPPMAADPARVVAARG